MNNIKKTVVKGAVGATAKEKIKRVLIVDDHESSQQLMIFLLGGLGCDHESAWNGQEAVERALAKDFDLVLMDLRMPVMDGYEAAREIHKVKKDLPIFALTAYAADDVPSKCLAAGMTGCMFKPVDIDKLKELIVDGVFPK